VARIWNTGVPLAETETSCEWQRSSSSFTA